MNDTIEYVTLDQTTLAEAAVGQLFRRITRQSGAVALEAVAEIKIEAARLNDDTVEDVSYTFDTNKGEYVETGRTTRADPLYSLDELKQRKLDEIQAAHDAELYTSFTSSALGSPRTYSYSKAASERLQGWLTIINANPQITTVDWYTREDGKITHTREQFIGVCMDGALRAHGIEDKQITLNDQVSAATDKAAVDAIVW